MGLERDVPCAKGAICYGLDQFSKGPGARNRVRQLRDAIAALAPTYEGLAEVFDEHLLTHVFNTSQRRSAVAKLNKYWFDPNSPTTLFPGKPVARIYAQGVLRTLDLSLRGGGRAVPIESWWIVDSTEFRMLNFADVEAGKTVGARVILLIMTPRPAAGGPAIPARILGHVAEAYSTEDVGRAVVTARVRGIK
jgi:hypothetical protein